MAGGFLVLLTVTPACATDRIWLKATGDYVEVESWREAGGMIVYPRYGGEIAVAKPEVLKIEHVKRDPTVEVLSAPTLKSASKSAPTPTSTPGPSADPHLSPIKAPASVLAELDRLRKVAADAREAMFHQQAEKQKFVLKLMQDYGVSMAAAERQAHFYDEFITERQKIYDDAQRRFLDFESHVRAQYAELRETK
jgi:hypothetical protein